MSSVQVHSVGDEMKGRVKVTLEYDGAKHVVEGESFICNVRLEGGNEISAGHGSSLDFAIGLLDLTRNILDQLSTTERAAYLTGLFTRVCKEDDFTGVLKTLERIE